MLVQNPMQCISMLGNANLCMSECHTYAQKTSDCMPTLGNTFFVHNPGQCACAEGCVVLVDCKHQFVHDRSQCAYVEGCVLVYALPRTIHMRSRVFNARAHSQAPVCVLLRFVSMHSGQCKVSLH